MTEKITINNAANMPNH